MRSVRAVSLFAVSLFAVSLFAVSLFAVSYQDQNQEETKSKGGLGGVPPKHIPNHHSVWPCHDDAAIPGTADQDNS